MPKGVNYPLYIPPSCQDVARLIESLQSVSAVELLRKKVTFGNREASALLVYIYLHDAPPKEEFAGAFEKCRTAAEAGEPYAELAMSQIKLARGKYPEALTWLQKACDQQFPPALSQMGRLMMLGIGFPRPDRASAMIMYRLALKYRHVPALVLVSKNLMGSRNPIVWLLGALLAPLAILVTSLILQLAPFKLTSFLHIPGSEPPLFSTKKPAPRS